MVWIYGGWCNPFASGRPRPQPGARKIGELRSGFCKTRESQIRGPNSSRLNPPPHHESRTATMKLFVAFLIVTVLTLTGTVSQSQSTRRKVAKNEVGKPGNDTMKICQGLAIPQDYVIAAYTTSSVCPH